MALLVLTFCPAIIIVDDFGYQTEVDTVENDIIRDRGDRHNYLPLIAKLQLFSTDAGFLDHSYSDKSFLLLSEIPLQNSLKYRLVFSPLLQ